MQRLDALIFDLEGTLVDSTVDIGHCLNRLLEEEGRPALSKEQAKDCIVEGMMDSCQNALEATGGIEGGDVFPYVKRLIEHIRHDKPSPDQIYPYVRETLEKYKGLGLKIGICTNKNEEATKTQLEALGLIDFFDFIAGGNTFMTHKPNPDHVNGVLEKISADASHTLFIGDGMGDLLACEGAKVPCIIITHGAPHLAQDDKAAAQISEFNELGDCIEKLGFEV